VRAKFPQSCALCDQPVKRGHRITRHKAGWSHWECANPARALAAAAESLKRAQAALDNQPRPYRVRVNRKGGRPT